MAVSSSLAALPSLSPSPPRLTYHADTTPTPASISVDLATSLGTQLSTTLSANVCTLNLVISHLRRAKVASLNESRMSRKRSSGREKV